MEDNEFGECLNCGKSEKLRRGLCSADYQRFLRQQKRLNAESAVAYETHLINANKLLPNRKGIRPGLVNDPLSIEFEAFIAENPEALTVKEIDANLNLTRKVRDSKKKKQ